MFFQSAGLGGMKPNILALGFYDNSMSVDCLDDLKKKFQWKPKVIRTLTRDESCESHTYINRFTCNGTVDNYIKHYM